MLVVSVHLWPGGNRDKSVLLATGVIINDATGTKEVGNYNIVLSKQKHYRVEDHPQPWKQVEVKNFPRLRKNVWNLLYRALKEAYE